MYGKCAPVNNLCNTFDLRNGNCLSCFNGFELNYAICVKSNNTLNNPYCSNFNNGICNSCSKGYYFN